MTDKKAVLQKNREHQKTEARRKAIEAIQMLEAVGESINFSSVNRQSGVSRSFLYEDTELRQAIEQHRKRRVQNDMNRRAKYDKTSSSKDVLIKAKDKRIAKLEEENKRLKTELMHLRGLLYYMNQSNYSDYM